jgi:polyhydroxybutyrate depolymerase
MTVKGRSAIRAAGLVLAISAMASACGDDGTGVPEPEGDGVFGEWVRSSGNVRTYELRLPPGHDENEPTPLLVAFHGNPDTGAGFEARSGLTAAASAAGFITVYPDGLLNTWGPWDDDLPSDLVRHMSETVAIDSSRIYVTGFSAGGARSHIVVCDYADLFAAEVSVGAMLERDTYTECDLARPIPTLWVHGTEDTAFPWDGVTMGSRRRFSVQETMDRWTQLNGCVGDPVVDTLPDLVDDSTRVWTERWTNCAGNSEVMLYGIEGGGHTWPSGPGPFPPGRITREISSTEIVEFLQRHSLGG